MRVQYLRPVGAHTVHGFRAILTEHIRTDFLDAWHLARLNGGRIGHIEEVHFEVERLRHIDEAMELIRVLVEYYVLCGEHNNHVCLYANSTQVF